MPFPLFHLAFPVRDLEVAKKFYVDVLDAKIGRVRSNYADLYLLGGQVTLHEQPEQVLAENTHGVRHFGAVLGWAEWEVLAQRLEKKNVQFRQKPTISFAGTDAEQAKFFLTDPSGNVVELKSYRHPAIALENDDLQA